MSEKQAPHLFWVCDGRLDNRLDAATWLSTTHHLRQSGWEVTLVAAGNPKHNTIRGVEITCISTPDIYFLRKLIFYVRLYGLLIRCWRITDVVLFHEMSGIWLLPLQPLSRLLSNSKSRPLFVLDTRTFPMEPAEKSSWRDLLRAQIYSLSRFLARRWADGHTAITPRMAQALHIPENKLWGIWSSGVDLGLFCSAIRQRSWPSVEEPVQLIYVGSLHYERNLMALCRAVKQANLEDMAFVLTLIGDGTERQILEEFAAGEPGIIRVVRSIPHNEIPHWLAQAHVGVLPFPDEEKFRVSSPIKLFEYMASGLSILATRIDCHTDVIGDGECVFWAEDSSVEGLFLALQQVWKSKDALPTKGRQSAQNGTAWSWQTVSNSLKNALENGLEMYG